MAEQDEGCVFGVAVWFDVRLVTDHTDEGWLRARTQAAQVVRDAVLVALRNLEHEPSRLTMHRMLARPLDEAVHARTGGD